ncbi:hypothetical protein [Yinghuangia soli]|uniref:Uncharacterized protein n=1 Tax=Yinghuangia soli TaxID=2908204 RepID=A0AA41PYW7_9ACTN|nr:hypothetical protein [Yinghuangia soli]MCF2527007.1 hypothetical protein [Yinghuangia soli]
MVVAVLLVATACVRTSSGPSEDSGYSVLSGTPILPVRTAEDLVSYGDHVLVVTVTAEREIPPSTEELRRGEGMILREVTLRVDETLWSRSGMTAPTSITSTASGWLMHDNKRRPFVSSGSPRLEPGHTYTVAMYRPHERGNAADDWVAFLMLAYDDGRIGNGEQAGGKPPITGALAASEGQPGSALATLLAATPPDPVSTKYLDLDGAARFRATAAEKPPSGVR